MLKKTLFLAFAIVWIGCTSNDDYTVGVNGTGGSKKPAELPGTAGTHGSAGVAGGLRFDGGASPSSKPDGSIEDTRQAPRGPTSGVAGQLIMVVRDFKFYDPADSTTHPDFENVPATDATGAPSSLYTGPWDDKEIVEAKLGADFKPVYKNAPGTTLTTHGKAAFDGWYRNVNGTNIAQQIPINLTRDSSGNYAYDSQGTGLFFSLLGGGFFPIDDGGKYPTAFGNQGQRHNFSFTVEIHTLFTYRGGEVFSFSGDDDVFVFIDNKLVINLGGIHSREPANVSLDTLGLTPWQTYPLDFFSAERHMGQSNVLITTTLELVPNPDAPIL